MNIFPRKPRFIQLCSQTPRVPLFGELSFPHLNPARLYRELYGKTKESFIFESSKGPQETARYSFLGCSNEISFQVMQNLACFRNNGFSNSMPYTSKSCFERMEFELDSEAVDYLPHFWGGWVGYFAYDMAKRFENISCSFKNGLNLPDLYFFQVERLFVYDHHSQTLKYILSEKTDQNPEIHYKRAVKEIQEMAEWIHCLGDTLQKPFNIHSKSKPFNEENSLQSNMNATRYMNMVRSAKLYIEAGDIYQANLAQCFQMNFEGDSFELYLKLREINPSPFSGFLKFKDFSIVSSSPERLLKLEGNRLETRPIAGTRPRGKTLEEDQSLGSELLLNEKEKAEHLMLVDLERNDLGRICDYGTVKVTDLMFLEKYSHVTHIVSNITGKIRNEIQLSDIIQALFPGGTITGCPKIRCMEIIDELEPEKRGPYSGSFGYIGFNRNMDLNIIIRTLIIMDGKAYFHVGAGIVADSIPEREYQETLVKAAAMKQALLF